GASIQYPTLKMQNRLVPQLFCDNFQHVPTLFFVLPRGSSGPESLWRAASKLLPGIPVVRRRPEAKLATRIESVSDSSCKNKPVSSHMNASSGLRCRESLVQFLLNSCPGVKIESRPD